jgi:alkaline phosphatase D
MLWLGDNTYYREIDWTSSSMMRYRYSHTRALPILQPLLGATHNYAIWDDHDFGPNDADRTYGLRTTALDIFRLFWANHTYGIPEVEGVFGRFEWYDVEFFLLDNRYHRSPNSMPDTPEKQMFGAGQLRWIREALVSSNATFKIIAAGNQMLNPGSRHEAFSNYRHEYRELLSWIKSQRIRGIVFISGDAHLSELVRLDDPSFYPLYDFTCSPLTAGVYIPDTTQPRPSRVPGTVVTGKRNFGILRFDGVRNARVLTMECYDAAGTMLWSHRINASELAPRGVK